MKYFIFFTAFFCLFFTKNIKAQTPTTLQPGDIVVLGYNTNIGTASTSNCGSTYSTDDMIVLMTLVDINTNTEIIVTDKGYINNTGGTLNFFDLEGCATLKRTGGTIPKGTVFEVVFGTATAFCGSGSLGVCADGWQASETYPLSVATMDMNSTSGDNFFILQGTFANNTNFTGRILYGLSTTGSWSYDTSSQSTRFQTSNLPPVLGNCLSRASNDTDKSKYNGTLTSATKASHLSAIANNANWSTTLPNMNPTCPTSAVFTISNLPATFTIQANPTNVGGADQIICGNSTNMQATGTGTWTLISGTGTIATPTSATTAVTGLGTGTNILRWTTNNCAVFDVNITVSPAVVPSVSITTTNPDLCPNTSLTFNATPTNGGTAPSYQWKVNGANVGTNSASYTNATLQSGDQITVVMTSNTNCAVPTTATSNSITVATNVIPSVTIQNNNPQICANFENVFSANITNGGANPTYQWKINGTNAGTGQTTFTTSSLQVGDVVTLTITSNATCVAPAQANSNSLVAVFCATPPPPPPPLRNDFFIPELFTPNGDNKNDIFVIKGNKNDILEFSLKIYDRYGNLVGELNDFETATQAGWNGKNNDKEQPTGVYFWELKGKLANGNNLDYQGKNKGSLKLLR